jgi:hypothetical protein
MRQGCFRPGTETVPDTGGRRNKAAMNSFESG